MSKILIVEDEVAIAELEKDYLELSGFDVVMQHTGDAGLKAALNEDFNLIILDLMLPNVDGFEICKKVREKKNTPIIMVSAKKEDIDKIRGLGLGADDYIIKPFDSKELVARVRAVLRRFHVKSPSAAPKEKCVSYPDLVINLTNYSVTYMGHQIDMPPKELELLYFLASSPNQVFTREQLLDHIWGYEYIGDTRTVDVHIKRLREKIKDHPHWNISTVWGIGYKFETK